MELRVASWVSGDKNMQDAYNRGSDLHESTLELIFGDDKIDPEQDHDGAKRQRTQAKISNFSLVYGAVPESLVRYAKGWGVNIPNLCISALADVVFSKELDHSKFTVLGSVHDAILIECKDEYAEELGQKVAEIMRHPSVLTDIGLEMPVPLKGDVEIGEAWGM